MLTRLIRIRLIKLNKRKRRHTAGKRDAGNSLVVPGVAQSCKRRFVDLCSVLNMCRLI